MFVFDNMSKIIWVGQMDFFYFDILFLHYTLVPKRISKMFFLTFKMCALRTDFSFLEMNESMIFLL